MSAGTGTAAAPRGVTLADLRRLYVDDGLGCREIGERTGLDRETVRRRLATMGVQRRRRGGHGSPVPAAELVEFYEEHGLTLEQLADRFGINRETVRRRLVGLGCTMRPPGRRTGETTLLSDDDRERTVQLYEQHGLDGAAEQLGIHAESVRWRLRSAGVALEGRRAPRLPAVPTGLQTLRDAAPALGVTPTELARRCASGEIPGAVREQQWPGRWLIPETSA